MTEKHLSFKGTYVRNITSQLEDDYYGDACATCSVSSFYYMLISVEVLVSELIGVIIFLTISFTSLYCNTKSKFMIFTKEMNKVDIISNTMEGIKSLFNFSLYLLHSTLCPPAEHNVKSVMLLIVVSKLRKLITKSINSKITAIA